MSKIKISSEELRNIAARQKGNRLVGEDVPKPKDLESTRRGLAAVAASTGLLQAPVKKELLPATTETSVEDFVVPTPTPRAPIEDVKIAHIPNAAKKAAELQAETARQAELDALIAEQAAEMAREAEAANRATHPDNYDTPKDEYLQSLKPTDGDALREERNAYDRFRRDTAHIRDYEGHVPFDSNDYGASQDDAGPDDPLEGMQIERPYVPAADRKSHK